MKEKKKIGIVSYLMNQKSLILILVFLAIGVSLLMLPNAGKNQVSKYDSSEKLNKYTLEMENKIADLCSRVKGVSNVKVSLYFDSGFETVYAYNEESKMTTNGLNSEKKYVTVGSGNDESMVCIVEKMPNICGVAIVCHGGGNSLIANELINLISSAYGVPKNKIYVTEGKK